jgi:fibronectin type 3 domain-containing protein
MSICEWEMYGVDSGKAYVEPAPTTTTTKKTTKKTTTTTALKLATPKVTASNATKGIKVSWGKVSKASSYRVYRRLYSSGKWGSWSKIKTTTSLTYTDESAKAGKNYQYMVKAVKGSVTSGYKAVSITRLSVPKVTVSNASKGVKVSWGKVTGASKYTVYRKTGSGSWSKIKTTTSTSYTDTKASAGKSYQYMVKAVKGDYTSYYKAASIRRLKAPSSVKLAKATKGFKVSWSKVTGATKYEVYRKTGNGSYTKIATTTKTAYTDKTAKKDKYYTYRVRAVYSSYKSVFKTGSKTKR